MLEHSPHDSAIGATSEVQRRAFVSENLACCLGDPSETCTPEINQGAVYIEKNEHRNTGKRMLLFFTFVVFFSLDVFRFDVVGIVKFVILGFILVDEFTVGEHEVTNALLGGNW